MSDEREQPPTGRPQHVPPALRWRVGRSQPHNVYLGDVHHLVVLGEPALAARLAEDLVAVLNADTDRRARVVTAGTDGPDQGDPAAWKAGDDAVLTDGTPVVLLYRTGPGPSLWWVARPDGHGRLCHVDALRAPGAVAAAPPGDEAEVEPLAALREWGVTGADAVRAGSVLTAAPPTGHEDEAAVERAIDQHIAALVRTPEHAYRDMLHALWQAGLSGQVPATVIPRTPDSGAGA